jgi:hypothetical protein
MSRFARMIVIACQIVGLGACAVPTRQLCAPGMGAPMTTFTLYLGKAISGRGDLTEKEWQSFLDDTVTADLPNGYTILDASGAWMNPITRKTINEASKVLIVALPETPDSLMAVNRIRRDYQIKFHQQLVGMTVERVCGAF